MTSSQYLDSDAKDAKPAPQLLFFSPNFEGNLCLRTSSLVEKTEGALFTSRQLNSPVFPFMVRFWYNSEKSFNNSSALSRKRQPKREEHAMNKSKVPFSLCVAAMLNAKHPSRVPFWLSVFSGRSERWNTWVS
jgi:hypothetical protein